MQPADIGVPAQEPQQFPEDAAGVDLLRRHQRETLTQVEGHLMAEDTQGPGAGTILTMHAFGEDPSQQVKVDLHVSDLPDERRLPGRWHERPAHDG